MKDDKKEQIVEAAVECFIDYGYEKTTMSDIGRKVGLNKASLYYHFKDKLALFEEVMNRRRRVHETALSKELDGNTETKEKILLFLCRELDFIEETAINIMGDQHNKSETLPVLQKITADVIKQLAGLLHETPNPGENAALIFKTCWGLLLADCPLDMPRSKRPAGYQLVRENVQKAIGLQLKGLGL